MKNKKAISIVLISLLVVFSFASVASAEWYTGKIKRVIKNPSNYVVVYTNLAGDADLAKQLDSGETGFNVMMAMMLTAYANYSTVDIYNDSGTWTGLRIKED